MVVAVGALALSVGGNVTAAVLITSADIQNDTIRSVDIRDGTIKSRDIDNGAVTGADVANAALTGADVKDRSLTPLDFSGSIQGPRGPRGPSNAYEQRPSSSQITASSGEYRTVTLANLPAGAYAIFGKALLGSTDGTDTSVGHCSLTAGTSSDLSYERLSDRWFGHIDTSVVHTFTTTGTVTMSCAVFGQPWILSQGSDTSIVAIRVDAATKTSAAVTATATATGSPAEGATVASD